MDKEREDKRLKLLKYVDKLLGQTNIQRKDILLGIKKDLNIKRKITERQLKFICEFMKQEVKRDRNKFVLVEDLVTPLRVLTWDEPKRTLVDVFPEMFK